MGKILIGLAIALLDFPLELAGGRILDLTPDILGYILVAFGLRNIGSYSHKFAIAYKLNAFTIIASGAVLGANLLLGAGNLSMTVVLLGIGEMVFQVILMVLISGGFREMEEELDINLNSKWLKIIAICIAPGIVLGYAGLIVPALEMVGSLVVDIASFGYLILFYFAWEAYRAWRKNED